MKHLIKLFVISAVLIGSIFLLDSSNTVSALSNTGNLNVQVNNTTGYCVYWSWGWLNFGNTGFSYNARYLQSGFNNTGGTNTWYCDDSEWDSGWNLYMQSSDLVNSWATSIKVTSWYVRVINNTGFTMSWSAACKIYSWWSLGTAAALSGPVLLFGKYNSLGETCRIGTTGLQMKIYLYSGQAPGIYSWTLTITIPNFDGLPSA